MTQLRSNHRADSGIDNSYLARRKIQARRGLASRRRVFTIAGNYPPSRVSTASSASSPPESPRAVLGPLHFNLRRLPSRLFSERREKEESMHDVVEIGTKRKRVVSGPENSQANGRGSSGRLKRLRSSQDSSDEESSGMEVDDRNGGWDTSENSDEEGDLDSCKLLNPFFYFTFSCVNSRTPADNYLINEALPRQLLRLRKDELVRLYVAAGLLEDAELLTKHEIVDCIVAARDELASLPPSSPPGVPDSNSSDCSSDCGNMAGGEETDFSNRLRNGLRRHTTVQQIASSSKRPGPDRSFSMNDMERRERFTKTRLLGHSRVPSQMSARRFVCTFHFLLPTSLTLPLGVA